MLSQWLEADGEILFSISYKSPSIERQVSAPNSVVQIVEALTSMIDVFNSHWSSRRGVSFNFKWVINNENEFYTHVLPNRDRTDAQILDKIKDTHSHKKYLRELITTHSLMPVGGTKEEYEKNCAWVYELCSQYNFRFSPRLHLNLFGNAVGT